MNKNYDDFDGFTVNLFLDEELYHALTDEAAKAGMSLSALIARKLSSTASVVQEG